MNKMYDTSTIVVLFMLGIQAFAAEKIDPDKRVETPILAGDSLSVNMDARPESV